VSVKRSLTRREFIRTCAAGGCLLWAGGLAGLPPPARAQAPRRGFVGTALSPWFEALDGGAVRCTLCPRRCRVAPGARGYCRVRENRGGKYYSLVYGNPCAVQLDPIEKKPFFHVRPATTSFSIATAGCNFECKFCQNWEISQAAPEELFNIDLPPERVVQRARDSGASSIAYTYVEPTIFFEYMLDTARRASAAGLLNVCHSNGFINPAPLRELCGPLDAANCDLKGFTPEYYREMCGGELEPVLESLKIIRAEGVHLELTNLVVPTKNDDPRQIREMCDWIARELGPDTPLHFSRFHPLYKLRSLVPTPVATLEKARETALAAGLRYVYVGNVPGHPAESTYCPSCKRLIIERRGFAVGAVHLEKGACAFCGHAIPGLWG
jgi:pyruvate formate lyase activating enzyme